MPEIYGNKTGLAPSAIKTLEHIYRRKIPLDRVATPELIRSLCDASRQTGRQVGALVHRSGKVDYVVVGDASRLLLPDIGRLRAAEGRFRALRLIHTHLHGEALTRDDLVDLVRLRLDLVAAVQLMPDGNPRGIVYAYNTPPPSSPPYREVGPVAPHQLDFDFGNLMSSLEAEFAKSQRLNKVEAKDGRAILVLVGEKSGHAGARDDIDERLAELRELARTAGVEVTDTIVQLRDRIDPKFVMGKGKLDEVVVRAVETDAETLIFERNLSPAQISAIGKNTDLKIIDRTQLILDIFAQRAQSRDGKLQVELAQLKYSLPRLGQKDDALSRLTGGIGGRGPGETKLEIGRRRAKERVTHLEAQLKTLAKQRRERRRRRGRLEVPVVAIVGYTNAGKSTLLNTLTHSDVLAEDKLFATLDTRSRRLRFPEEREVVITDTVGFIRDLPKDLFAAFRATFEETADADLLLHVVDAADPAHVKHIETTEKLLADLSLLDIPRLLVFNKIDLVAPTEAVALRRARRDALFVCAKSRETTRALLDRVAERLAERWEAAETYPHPAPVEGAGEPSLTAGESADAAEQERANDENSLTTLEELLGSPRRHRHRSQAPA
ncbi:MAG TPA: GTPase HflX [Polyangiaceae bacterium]|jgi:GTP-binding protein HflX|nr:GTPase HflX [Polyangiaceae bacterium]